MQHGRRSPRQVAACEGGCSRRTRNWTHARQRSRRDAAVTTKLISHSGQGQWSTAYRSRAHITLPAAGWQSSPRSTHLRCSYLPAYCLTMDGVRVLPYTVPPLTNTSQPYLLHTSAATASKLAFLAFRHCCLQQGLVLWRHVLGCGCTFNKCNELTAWSVLCFTKPAQRCWSLQVCLMLRVNNQSHPSAA